VLTKKALEDAKITANDVSMVVLAGGATHSPVVSQLVKQTFPGKEVNRSVDPDQAVVMGAGILALDISGDSKNKQPTSLLLINVLPMSLGIETADGAMCTLLPRDTSIPTVRKHTFTTTEDNQEVLIVTIYEGENKLVKDNNVLGKFVLTGIPPAPKGEPAIEVALHIDADGILSVKAYDKIQAKELETPVQKWTLTKQEVDKLREGGFYYEETHLPKKPSHLDEID
jgi:heat shock protein 1/8